MSTEAESVAKCHPFQAEVAELLRLMVHAVYSENDIFLRELISNASDACDKLRYEAIAKPDLLGDGAPLAIRITPDEAAGTLTIADNGIGMDRQELIDNLGTVARSGTRAFMSKLAEAKDGAGLIGQFGVGFYSAFMVADRIEVTSRRAGADEAWVWASDGRRRLRDRAGERRAGRTRGARHRDRAASEGRREELSRAHEIERIVRPTRTTSCSRSSSSRRRQDGEPKTAQINAASALWQRPKSELKPEDYKEAYQHVARAFDEPALTLHYKAEGRQSYAVLLFVPSTQPFDLFDPARKGHIKLYVRRVFITDDAELLPAYLRFVRGVVDSEDLPLNISREMLQNNPQVAAIRKAVTGRVMAELESLADKDARLTARSGRRSARSSRKASTRITSGASSCSRLRASTPPAGKARSLKQYVADLKPNQTEIYYLVGDSLERLKSSPKLEAARARGVEVLLLTDPVDAFWTSMPLGFEGKPLKSLSQGDVDFGLVPLLDDARRTSRSPTRRTSSTTRR